MKKLIVIKICAAILILNGCATFPFGSNRCALQQSFGVAIRSLEGSAYAQDATKVPAALYTLAAQWLPPNQYTDFVKGITSAYVAAHPITVDQVNKVLEALAMQVQTAGCH